MELTLVIGLLSVVLASTGDPLTNNTVELSSAEDIDANTEIQLAFVVFRHGDRTPDLEELDLYPTYEDKSKIFFPYGVKALTNKGKQRGFSIGTYLRRRYGGLVSKLYLPDEIMARTTNYARTKMTVLTALAALYPPPPAQRWNPILNWQPVPYDTPSYENDYLLYWYNCPRYLWLRNKMYELPDVKKRTEPYQGLFEYLQKHAGTNVNTTEAVFYLDNLFQALKNVGLNPPKWAEEVMPDIKKVTKIEYAIEFYTDELIRLAAGVLIEEILNVTSSYTSGDDDQPKLRLYSAHENNVAAIMAATRCFEPHQPNYGATFSLELRKTKATGKYGFLAVYSSDAGRPEKILQMKGCDQLLCDYDQFKSLVQNLAYSLHELQDQCTILD
ncbi:hypothetical protein K1T71_002423 [Dendrolimus kikuchii]|uniref:Uncharacterized protein n=1 Tax=Dendrolimus kikuchii TaxID=765133 RepID=A0ACC1DD01_9NEOP|nr:hypothetical protein K1T71_002423 [Dendrolimus kikuchii]